MELLRTSSTDCTRVRSRPASAKRWRLGLAALVAIALGTVATVHAHHSFPGSYRPDRLISVRGTVAEFHYRNPHILIVLDEVDESGGLRTGTDGQPLRWTAGTLRQRVATRRHFRRDSLRPGRFIAIRGWASRLKGVRTMGVSEIIRESGHVFVCREEIGVGRVEGAAPYPSTIPSSRSAK